MVEAVCCQLGLLLYALSAILYSFIGFLITHIPDLFIVSDNCMVIHTGPMKSVLGCFKIAGHSKVLTGGYNIE